MNDKVNGLVDTSCEASVIGTGALRLRQEEQLVPAYCGARQQEFLQLLQDCEDELHVVLTERMGAIRLVDGLSDCERSAFALYKLATDTERMEYVSASVDDVVTAVTRRLRDRWMKEGVR